MSLINNWNRKKFDDEIEEFHKYLNENFPEKDTIENLYLILENTIDFSTDWNNLVIRDTTYIIKEKICLKITRRDFKEKLNKINDWLSKRKRNKQEIINKSHKLWLSLRDVMGYDANLLRDYLIAQTIKTDYNYYN